MTRFFKLLGKVVFPIAIGVALSFGATQAVGQMSAQRSCPWDPPDHLGECVSEKQCADDCDFYGGFGMCDHNNCCGCLFK